jgi:Reverse transcriptase (RNA-dependent DNA polymerase)
MPEGYEKRGKVIKLKKTLYGLRQSAFLWHEHLRGTLAKLGFKSAKSDVCLFLNDQEDTYVIVYVDDIQIFSRSSKGLQKTADALRKAYKITEVESDLFLGMQINRNKKTGSIRLSQEHYVTDLLKEYGLENCRSVVSPLSKLQEPWEEKASHADVERFQQLIGKLQWLANRTRDDIKHAVNHLAQFLSNPSPEHHKEAIHVLRYLAGSRSAGPRYKRVEHDHLHAYSDADFAGDPATSRSTTGSVIMLCGAPVITCSKRQRSVVLSTTEAEHLALTETLRELAWIKGILKEIGVQEEIEGMRHTRTFVDNQSTIKLVKNHANHRRSKHVALRNHYCREQYLKGAVEVEYVETSKQKADKLTKVTSKVDIF